MIIVTTYNIPCFSIVENLGVIQANQVVGANVISDFIASFSDFFGGTSGAYRDKLNDLFQFVKKQLTEKASMIGANAILGLKIGYNEISGKGKSMFMVSCIGTAVVISPNNYEKYEKLYNLSKFLQEGIISPEQYDEEKQIINKMYNLNILDNNHLEQHLQKELLGQNSIKNNISETEQYKKVDNNIIIPSHLKSQIAQQMENIWMMSIDGIKESDAPSYVRGSNIEENVLNLIIGSRFNEAAKLCCISKNMTAEDAYDYIMSICVSAGDSLQEDGDCEDEAEDSATS